MKEADGQFQDLSDDIIKYKDALIATAAKEGKFSSDEFNLNTFQALMDFYFPEHEKHVVSAAELYKEINELKIPTEYIAKYAEQIKPLVPFIDKKLFGEKSHLKTHQSNLMSYAIQAFHKEANRSNSSKSRLKLIKEIEQLAK